MSAASVIIYVLNTFHIIFLQPTLSSTPLYSTACLTHHQLKIWLTSSLTFSALVEWHHRPSGFSSNEDFFLDALLCDNPHLSHYQFCQLHFLKSLWNHLSPFYFHHTDPSCHYLWPIILSTFVHCTWDGLFRMLIWSWHPLTEIPLFLGLRCKSLTGLQGLAHAVSPPPFPPHLAHLSPWCSLLWASFSSVNLICSLLPQDPCACYSMF